MDCAILQIKRLFPSLYPESLSLFACLFFPQEKQNKGNFWLCQLLLPSICWSILIFGWASHPLTGPNCPVLSLPSSKSLPQQINNVFQSLPFPGECSLPLSTHAAQGKEMKAAARAGWRDGLGWVAPAAGRTWNAKSAHCHSSGSKTLLTACSTLPGAPGRQAEMEKQPPWPGLNAKRGIFG